MKYKLEMKILTVFLLLLIIPTALSVTRTISSSQDNIDSFIVNSHGNLWEANGSYIQAAIDNLSLLVLPDGGWGGPFGMVWLPPNTTLVTNETIVVETHVILDMQGSTIIPSGDFDVFELRVGSRVINGIVNVSSVSNYDSAVITLRETDYFQHEDYRASAINMELISDGLRGKGIYLNTYEFDGDDYWQAEYANFHNIVLRNFEYAILQNHTKDSPNAYLNANLFKNIYGYNNKYFITIYELYWEASGSYWQNIYCYCTNNTEYIIWNNAQGGVFDNIIAYNWDNNSGTRTSYNFDTSGNIDNNYDGGDQCFISFRGAGEDLAVRPWSWKNRLTTLNLETGNLSIGEINVS